MLVKITPYICQSVVLQPVNARRTQIIMDDMRRNGCARPQEDAYIEFMDELQIHMAERAFRDLQNRNTVICRMDDWIVRHLYGYCAD